MKIGIAYPTLHTNFLNTWEDVKVIESRDDIAWADLVVFTGGEDISPSIYGHRATYTSGTNMKRDNTEKNVFNYASRLNKHMLGICRGHQLIAGLKGTRLVQDINQEEYRHHGYHHNVDWEVPPIDRSYPFAEAGKEIVDLYSDGVNSLHHQGYTDPSFSTWVLGVFGEIVEATINKRIITTQFHPEMLSTFRSFLEIVERWVERC